MSKPNPRPWHVKSHGTTEGNTTIEIHDADGCAVAVCAYWGNGVREANAELIVRAVNSFNTEHQPRWRLVTLEDGKQWVTDGTTGFDPDIAPRLLEQRKKLESP